MDRPSTASAMVPSRILCRPVRSGGDMAITATPVPFARRRISPGALLHPRPP